MQTWLELIRSFLTEKRESLFMVLILAVMGLTAYFFYEQYQKSDSNCIEEIKQLKVDYNSEIKELRYASIKSELYFQEEISRCKRDARMALDSIEDYYYSQLRKRDSRLDKLEALIKDKMYENN